LEYALFRRAAQQLTIRSQRDGHAHVVQLTGELDMDTAQAFEDELERVEATTAREIIVDLSGLKFIGSDGLKVFIHASARSRRQGNRLKLVRGPDHVHEAFETSGLVSHLPFVDGREMGSMTGPRFAER
jgi:anti-sigma B factor antagonist